MDEDPHFSERTVAIFGLGLMGGSLAMAIKGHCHHLFGIDPDLDALYLANQLGLFDELDSQPANWLNNADLLILAAPVMSILNILIALPEIHSGKPIVIDLGSTKNVIMKEMNDLPPRFDPIGGHPMCGKEKGTLKNSSPNLFQDSQFVISPLDRTTEKAKKIALEMIEIIGARVLWLDPITHDRWVAGTSHLPYLASNAIAASIPEEYAPLVGTGYRSTTRLAISSPRMMTDNLITNRENILDCLHRLQQNLDLFERLLAQNDAYAIYNLLTRNAAHQEQILKSLGDAL